MHNKLYRVFPRSSRKNIFLKYAHGNKRKYCSPDEFVVGRTRVGVIWHGCCSARKWKTGTPDDRIAFQNLLSFIDILWYVTHFFKPFDLYFHLFATRCAVPKCTVLNPQHWITFYQNNPIQPPSNVRRVDINTFMYKTTCSKPVGSTEYCPKP